MGIQVFQDLHPNIHDSVYIHNTATIIGDVSIGRDSSVWPQSVIRGDINKIVIGERSNIQDGSIIHVTHAGRFNPDGAAVAIGDGVIVGHHVTLHGCTIKNRVLIGIGAIVMDKAIVHEQVIVAAGAVVGPGKELESGYIWLGNPIRRGRALTDKEMEYFDYSADYYVSLKNQYLKIKSD